MTNDEQPRRDSLYCYIVTLGSDPTVVRFNVSRILRCEAVIQFAYRFERFPSFGQTFCYREVAELDRQDVTPPIFSIRNPKDEPPQDWDTRIVERVHYLPEEKELLEVVRRDVKKRK